MNNNDERDYAEEAFNDTLLHDRSEIPTLAYTLEHDVPVVSVKHGDIIIRDGLAFEVRGVELPTRPAVVATFRCNILGAPHDAAPLYAGVEAHFDMVARKLGA